MSKIFIINQGIIYLPAEANGKMLIAEHGSDWIAVEADDIDTVRLIACAYDRAFSGNNSSNSTFRRLYKKKNTWIEMRQKYQHTDLTIEQYAEIPNVVVKAKNLSLTNIS